MIHVMSGRDDQTGAGTTRERILVVCTRYIGDTVLAIPFLRNLRRAHPDAIIDVFAERAAREVLADCPYVDELVAWSRPRRGWLSSLSGLREQAGWLRSRGYGRAYLLKRSTSGAILAFRAGIPHRVGFATECSGLLLSRAVCVHRGRHQVQAYLDLLRAEGIAVDDGRNENWVSGPASGRGAELLAGLPSGRPLVFLAIRGSDATRFWRLERWTQLVAWLVDHRGCEVVLCGSPDDRVDHDRLRADVGPAVAAHVHEFSQAVPLREVGGIMLRMDLCIGVDTGLVHLAASFRVPVVVLVGPTDPNQWSPWMTRSEVVRSPRVTRGAIDRLLSWIRPQRDAGLRWLPGRASLADVTVDEVMCRVATLLPDAKAPVPPADMKTIDLRDVSFTYAVVSRLTDVPATKPLAHAH
jgi:heptosyltransferase-2